MWGNHRCNPSRRIDDKAAGKMMKHDLDCSIYCIYHKVVTLYLPIVPDSAGLSMDINKIPDSRSVGSPGPQQARELGYNNVSLRGALPALTCFLWLTFCCAWLYDPVTWRTSCPHCLVSIRRSPTATALLVSRTVDNTCSFGLSIPCLPSLWGWNT